MATRAIDKSRLVLAALTLALGAMAGCTADPREVYQAVKEIEPDAKQRQQEVRELTGVPEEQDE